MQSRKKEVIFIDNFQRIMGLNIKVLTKLLTAFCLLKGILISNNHVLQCCFHQSRVTMKFKCGYFNVLNGQ